MVCEDTERVQPSFYRHSMCVHHGMLFAFTLAVPSSRLDLRRARATPTRTSRRQSRPAHASQRSAWVRIQTFSTCGSTYNHALTNSIYDCIKHKVANTLMHSFRKSSCKTPKRRHVEQEHPNRWRLLASFVPLPHQTSYVSMTPGHPLFSRAIR